MEKPTNNPIVRLGERVSDDFRCRCIPFSSRLRAAEGWMEQAGHAPERSRKGEGKCIALRSTQCCGSSLP